MSDPLIEENGKWYFWDETETDKIGPFASEGMARHHVKEYVKYLDNGPSEEGSEYLCSTVAEWINLLAFAHEQKKPVMLNDTPRDRLLGFLIGGVKGETISIKLEVVKKWTGETPEDLAALKRIGFTEKQMRLVTMGHWTTFNSMLTIKDEIVGHPKYPGESEEKLLALMPWAKDRANDPISISTAMRPLLSLGVDKVFLLLKVNMQPYQYQEGLEYGLRVMKHGAPDYTSAQELLQKALDDFKDTGEENPKLTPFNVASSCHTTIQARMRQQRIADQWPDEENWQLREFLNVFGLFPANDATMARIEGWTGKPFQGPLTRELMVDAFAAVGTDGVSTLLVSEKTRGTLFHGLVIKSEDDDQYVDLGGNSLWGAHIETADIPDNKIYLIGENNIQRVDLAE